MAKCKALTESAVKGLITEYNPVQCGGSLLDPTLLHIATSFSKHFTSKCKFNLTASHRYAVLAAVVLVIAAN